MNFTQLNGVSIINDAKTIIDDFARKKDVVYVFTHATTKLFVYIDMLHDNGVSDDIMFNLKICYNLRGIDLTYISEDRSGSEIKICSITELIERLDHTPCKIIVNNDKREELADIAQQLIYIGYPLNMVDIMLHSEAKDAEKTKRFMAKINDISDSIDTAIINIDRLCFVWEAMDIVDDEKKGLVNTISEAKQRCCSIKEQVEKAKSVEMKVAVAASKKSGKSVIVNSMIREELAPTSLEMATPNTCVYKKSRDDQYHLTYNDERTSYQTSKALYDVIDHEFKIAEQKKDSGYRIGDMVIEYVTEGNNFDTFTVFDTPGPDAAGTKHEEAAAKAIEKSDVAIFAIDYSKYLIDSELEYLAKIKETYNRNGKHAALLFAINKLDLRYDDANSIRSTVKSLDFIRTRLLQLSGKYGDLKDPVKFDDCIIFAVSALQYYNTIHCEKMCEQFRTSENLVDLRSLAICQTGAVRGELLKLNNIADHYYVEHNFDKVTAADLKQFSGMPDLLNYAEYICKSKAREEIVNNITVTIATQDTKFKAIVDRIDNIDRLIDYDKKQIEDINDVIKKYSSEVEDKLQPVIYKSELEILGGESRISGFFKEKDTPDTITFEEIKTIMSDKINGRKIRETEMLDEIFVLIREYTFAQLVDSIYSACNSKNIINNEKIEEIFNDVFSSKTIADSINGYICLFLEHIEEEEYPAIENLRKEIVCLINDRIGFIKDKSEHCREKLDKIKVDLAVPDIPDFKFDLPKYARGINYDINVDISFNTDDFKKLFIKKEVNPVHQFFRNLRDIDFGRRESVARIIDKEMYDEIFKGTHMDICGILQNANVYGILNDNIHKLADRMEQIVSDINAQFDSMLSAISDNVKAFTELIDDTKKHKENIDAHNREKALIKELNECYRVFSGNWEPVLRNISDKKEVLQ